MWPPVVLGKREIRFLPKMIQIYSIKKIEAFAAFARESPFKLSEKSTYHFSARHRMHGIKRIFFFNRIDQVQNSRFFGKRAFLDGTKAGIAFFRVFENGADGTRHVIETDRLTLCD